MNLGPMELLIIFGILLLIFGATRLPKLARSMGAASKEFKVGLKEGHKEETVEGPCPFCKADVPPEAKFCPNCGKPAEEIISARVAAAAAKPA